MASGDRCAWPRCAGHPSVGWLGKPLCERHWEKVCRLTSGGREGFLEAYGTLKVPKRLWARVAKSTEKPARPAGEYGDLPDPDEFDYSP